MQHNPIFSCFWTPPRPHGFPPVAILNFNEGMTHITPPPPSLLLKGHFESSVIWRIYVSIKSDVIIYIIISCSLNVTIYIVISGTLKPRKLI